MASSQQLKTEGTKTLTVPVSPHFRKVVSKGKEQKLTSEELLLQKLNQEKHAESERIAKAQKLYAMLKTRSNRRKSKLYGTNVLESAVKPKAPAVRQFVQPKKVAPSVVQASAIKRGQDGLTLFEPFQFATDKRAPPTTTALTTPDRVRAMPAAEMAQNFMKDARSHGVSSLCHIVKEGLFSIKFEIFHINIYKLGSCERCQEANHWPEPEAAHSEARSVRGHVEAPPAHSGRKGVCGNGGDRPPPLPRPSPGPPHL